MSGLFENTNTMVLQFNRQQSKQEVTELLNRILAENKSLRITSFQKPYHVNYPVDERYFYTWALLLNVKTKETYLLLITQLFLEYKILEEWID